MKRLFLLFSSVLFSVNSFSEVRTVDFIPQCANNHIQLSDEQILKALDSLKRLYRYEAQYSFFSAQCIKPNFESNEPEYEYMQGLDHLKNGFYIWSRLDIIDKEDGLNCDIESSLLVYMFDTERYEIRIKPQKQVDYKYSSHQSDVGFSEQDGDFYVKRASNGRIYLMVEHSDSKYREARLVSHGNCSYDLQYSSIMIKLKDGTVKTIPNAHPLHHIDCDDGTCHHFTDQFDITAVKVSNIVKIRLIDYTDKYDYNNEYIGEMLSLMQSAAIENYKESKAQDDF